MVEATLDVLLRYRKPRERDPQPSERRFVRSLQLHDGIVNGFFDLREEFKRVVSAILSDLCEDQGIIRQRQGIFRYLLDSASLPELHRQTSEAMKIIVDVLRLPVTRLMWPDPRVLNQYMLDVKQIVPSLRRYTDGLEHPAFSYVSPRVDCLDAVVARVQNEFPRLPYPPILDRWNAPIEFPTTKDPAQARDREAIDLGKKNSKIYADMREALQDVYSAIGLLECATTIATRFGQLRDSGVPMVFPEFSTDFRAFEARDAVNPLLYFGKNAERKKVQIDLQWDELQSIRLITGRMPMERPWH